MSGKISHHNNQIIFKAILKDDIFFDELEILFDNQEIYIRKELNI